MQLVILQVSFNWEGPLVYDKYSFYFTDLFQLFVSHHLGIYVVHEVIVRENNWQ
jgi:hypothetical protein